MFWNQAGSAFKPTGWELTWETEGNFARNKAYRNTKAAKAAIADRALGEPRIVHLGTQR
jgi:hypothetical protein